MPTTDQSRALVAALRTFDVPATIADVTRGATVDRYMLKPGAGVKVSQIAKLSDDLALALDVPHVRVLAASGHVAVEVPAAARSTVSLADVAAGLRHDHPLRVPVGVDVAGHGISARLDRLPHLLVAGTTGSGKSTWTLAILAHLATRTEPADLQLALIDPKRVELAPFAGLPHLWQPVARDVERAVEMLEALVEEIEARYERLETTGRRTVEEIGADRPPYLLLVVDELADLMMTAGKRAESALVRVLQIGRAAGVHAILATQRPSADVVTSLIKANTPSRLTFAVQSHVDSGVALGQSGAEALLGRGDGLWWPSGTSQPERVQAPYVSTDELDEMLEPLRSVEPERADAIPEPSKQRALCAAGGVRQGSDGHPCTCRRMPRHVGMHACECGNGWTGSGRPTTAPEVAAPPGPSELPTYVAPDAPPRQPMPAGELDRDTREALERAYAKGRRHGAILSGGTAVKYRFMMRRDWGVAAMVFVAVVLVSLFLFPLLPFIAGGTGAWLVTRRRRRVTIFGQHLHPVERETMRS